MDDGRDAEVEDGGDAEVEDGVDSEVEDDGDNEVEDGREDSGDSRDDEVDSCKVSEPVVSTISTDNSIQVRRIWD